MTFTFLQKDVRLDSKADDIPNNANGDGNLDYLSLSVKVANLLVVGNLSVGYSFLWKIFFGSKYLGGEKTTMLQQLHTSIYESNNGCQ